MAHGWQTTKNHGNISSGRQMNPQTNSQPTVRKTNNQLLRKEVDAAQRDFVVQREKDICFNSFVSCLVKLYDHEQNREIDLFTVFGIEQCGWA